jgi:hypothetical protein
VRWGSWFAFLVLLTSPTASDEYLPSTRTTRCDPSIVLSEVSLTSFRAHEGAWASYRAAGGDRMKFIGCDIGDMEEITT